MKTYLLLMTMFFSLVNTDAVNGQNTYYVTQNGAGNKDGTDWADAFNATSFSYALQAANSGSIFWVAAGTYTPGNGRDSSFIIPRGVKVYGGFPNGGNPNMTDRNFVLDTTILSGEIGTAALTDNCYHVVKFSFADTVITVLDGFTITGGYANGSNADDNGGGIYNDGSYSNLVGSSPTITNCKIINNYSAGWGGGIYNDGGNGGKNNTVITNCVFENNSADYGGAIYNYGQGQNAGVVSECGPLITRCKFERNSAAIGGAVVNNGTYGGSTNPRYINCLFIANTASSYGGVAFNNGESASVGCVVAFTNCTFDKDSGSSGSIMNNYTYNVGTCNVTLTNCIIWDCATPYISNYEGTNTTITYSDIEGGYSGANNISANPLFFDVANGDYRIASCSPCVNTGTAVGAPNIDMDVNPRPIGGAFDIGAYESLDTGIVAASVAVTISPSDTFCANTQVILTATTNAPSSTYTWKRNGSNIGTNSPYYSSDTLADGDVISCKVVSNASCIAPNNAVSSLTVRVLPVTTASFTVSNNGLTYSFAGVTTNQISFEWYFGDGDSSSQANPVHTYSTTGSYTAMLVAYNGCGSDTFRQNIGVATGVANLNNDRYIRVYPNPTKDKLFISVSGLQPELITLFDIAGEKISEQKFVSEIEITALASGVYFLEIKDGANRERRKFVKM